MILRLKSAGRRGASAPAINMTPMVDMVFLLLIFFLLTSIAYTRPSLDLKLPQAEHTGNHSGENGLRIVIRKGGQVEIDRQRLALNQVDRFLEQRLASKPGLRIVLSADESAPFGVFVHIADVLQGLNHHNLAIESRTNEDAP